MIRWVLLAIAAGTVSIVAGCNYIVWDWPSDGQVIDIQSHAAIPDALVITEWTGTIGGPVQTREVCFHLSVVKTDERGRYHVPGWIRLPAAEWESGLWGLGGISTTRRMYKEGYVEAAHYARFLPNILLVEPDLRSQEERVRYLARQGTPGCGDVDGSTAEELVLWGAICREASRYPQASLPRPTPRGETLLQFIRRKQIEITNAVQDPNKALPSTVENSCDSR